MKRKWVLTGTAFALAVALTGCGGNVATNTQEQSSQEWNDTTASSPTPAQTEASPSTTTVPTQSLTDTGKVDEAAAQKIAMDHAGVNAADATITKSKLDYEGKRQVYEIEWYANGAKYNYEIAVDSGEIISSSYEEKAVVANSNSANVTVSEADARKTVIDRVAGATERDIYEWKFDYDDGRPEYEGKIIYGGVEYEFTIDATNGSVVEWDAETVR